MSTASVLLTGVLVLAGIGLTLAPETMATRIRGGVTDSMRPGLIAARRLSSAISDHLIRLASRSERSRQKEVDRLKERLDQEQKRSAALEIQMARLAEIQTREQMLPEAMRSLPPLTSTTLIDASVLGEAVTEKWRKGLLLDRGKGNGVRESELVVKSERPLVDLGRDGNLAAEDALLLGRCVIGKIERVGHWTSTFLLLTDSGYRGRAQLVHQTDQGFVFGARGILEGQGGAYCRLKGVNSTESVSIGDAVYTATREGQSATPLYYGRVVEATLGSTDSEWKVLVEPVPVPSDLKTVQILRTTMNSERLSAGL